MENIIVHFQNQQYRISFFFDTLLIGDQANSPICNVYSILCGQETAAVIGEPFRVIHDTTNQLAPPVFFPVINPLNIAANQLKSA